MRMWHRPVPRGFWSCCVLNNKKIVLVSMASLKCIEKNSTRTAGRSSRGAPAARQPDRLLVVLLFLLALSPPAHATRTHPRLSRKQPISRRQTLQMRSAAARARLACLQAALEELGARMPGGNQRRPLFRGLSGQKQSQEWAASTREIILVQVAQRQSKEAAWPGEGGGQGSPWCWPALAPARAPCPPPQSPRTR